MGDSVGKVEYSYGLHSYGLHSYGLYSHGLYSFGLYSYDVYSYDQNLKAMGDIVGKAEQRMSAVIGPGTELQISAVDI